MEEKSSKKLDDLPGSEVKEFWGDAEVHSNLIPHNELSEKGHYFDYVTAVTAECRYCHWGFQLDPGDKIKKGHLYNKKGKFVI